MNRRIASLLFLAGLFTAFPAKARVYDLYRADAPKGAFCSAIGGACVADPDLVSGLLQNPASLSAGLPAWNFDFDYNFAGNSEPGAKSSNSITEGTYFAGIALNRGEWGVGLAVVGRKSQTETSVDVTDSQGLTQKFPLEATSTMLEFRLPVAYRLSHHLIIGLTFSATLWSQSLVGNNGSRADIMRQSAPVRWSGRIGIYDKTNAHWSFGSTLKVPATRYSHLTFDTQAYSNSLHYEEDIALHEPWIWTVGTRWTPWNDERALLFDLKTIGTTENGYQLTYDTFASAFGEKTLHEKGRSIIFEPHLGYQIPIRWIENRKSAILLGSFYENARLDGIDGRIHFTAGVVYEAIRDFQFMIGGDFARNFSQIFFTFR